MEFWDRLKTVKSFFFRARSKKDGGWDRSGEGTVAVATEGDDILIFYKTGRWTDGRGGVFIFSDALCWRRDEKTGEIFIEHRRQGQERPVFLVKLLPRALNALTSAECHICGKDRYFARVLFDKDQIHLRWVVIGPKKQEEIDFTYICQDKK